MRVQNCHHNDEDGKGCLFPRVRAQLRCPSKALRQGTVIYPFFLDSRGDGKPGLDDLIFLELELAYARSSDRVGR